MKTIEEILGENIKARREHLGMSREVLAKTAEVSKSTIDRLETGKQWPKIENLISISKALKCSKESLFDMLDPKKSSVSEAIQQLSELIKELQNGELKADERSLVSDYRNAGLLPRVCSRYFLHEDPGWFEKYLDLDQLDSLELARAAKSILELAERLVQSSLKKPTPS